MTKIDKTVNCEVCGKELKTRKARAGHMWFSHQMRVGKLWDLESAIKKLKEMVIFYVPCRKCKQPMMFDMNDESDREHVVGLVNKHTTMCHSECLRKEKNK